MSPAAQRIEALLRVCAQLRDPVHGCPWDRAQTLATIAPHTIEEAYEVADAIATAEPAKIRDELGDLLFQVLLHSQVASEQGWFDLADVAGGLHAKLVRRHPHVFGSEAEAAGGAAMPDWESHKAAERAAAGMPGALAGIPKALPALVRATKLSQRAARTGFDWPDEQAVRPKIAEELRETEAAVSAADPEGIAEELGDTLFALVNWGRLLQVEPEAALRAANEKFERRYAAMETMIAARGLQAAALSAEQWEQLWVEAKAALARRPG
jgi:nucleoside triphosphate diphosphatase